MRLISCAIAALLAGAALASAAPRPKSLKGWSSGTVRWVDRKARTVRVVRNNGKRETIRVGTETRITRGGTWSRASLAAIRKGSKIRYMAKKTSASDIHLIVVAGKGGGARPPARAPARAAGTRPRGGLDPDDPVLQYDEEKEAAGGEEAEPREPMVVEFTGEESSEGPSGEPEPPSEPETQSEPEPQGEPEFQPGPESEPPAEPDGEPDGGEEVPPVPDEEESSE